MQNGFTGYGGITSVIVILRGEETHSGNALTGYSMIEQRIYNSRTESESAAAGRAGRTAAGGAPACRSVRRDGSVVGGTIYKMTCKGQGHSFYLRSHLINNLMSGWP